MLGIICLLLLRVCCTQTTKWAVMGVLITGVQVTSSPGCNDALLSVVLTKKQQSVYTSRRCSGSLCSQKQPWIE